MSNSCKQPKPPKGIVFVIDEDNAPVEGAQVVVKPQNSDAGRQTVVYFLKETKNIADTQYTNEEGKIYYDFKYRAIYKVEVTKGTDRNHPRVRRGLGVLMLEEDKTIESKVKINEQTVF